MTTYTITQEQLDLLVNGLERYQVKRQDFERFFSELEVLRSLTPNSGEPVIWADRRALDKLPGCDGVTCGHKSESRNIPLFTHPAPSTKPADQSDLLEKFEAAVGNKTALHSEYQGKVMPDDVYAAFANLRDSRVPELRAQIAAKLAAPSTKPVPLSTEYIQQVPDKCDRIVWRNSYYRLQSLIPSKPACTLCGATDQCNLQNAARSDCKMAPAKLAHITVPSWVLKTTQAIALGMARKHYPEVPQFEVLDDLAGAISQIDNMTTGLSRTKPAQPLTDEQISALADKVFLTPNGVHAFARAIEAAHGIKGQA
jgi:hypothetical protein